MRPGWEIKTIGEVCEIRSGRNQKGIENPSGQYPIYGSGGIMGYADDYLCEAGATIIGRKGSINNPIFVETKFWNVDTAFGFSPKETILPKFLFYFCKGFNFQSMNKGTTIPSLVKTDLLQIRIPVPSIQEQQRIVDILDREFAKIDALKANAEKSLQAAKDLFQATLKKELEPKDGWETKHLNEWATYSIGLTYKPTDVSNEGTIVLRSSNIQNDLLVFDDIVRVACKVKDELFVEEGDILMCSRNGSARLVGKVARIGKERERMTYGTFMTIIRSKYNPVLFYYFKSDDFRSQISKGENTMINQITKNMLNDVVVSLPNKPKDISRIARTLDDLNDKCKALQDNYQKTLSLCDDLKQALLRKAFNGEL